MLTVDKDNLPSISPGDEILEFRVYDAGTSAWVWVDWSSRLKSFANPTTRVERALMPIHFDSAISDVKLDNSDGYFDKIVSSDQGLVNDSEPYGKTLRHRWVRIGRRLHYEDGTTATFYLGCGTVENISMSNMEGTVTLKLRSLARRAMEQKADGKEVNANTAYGAFGDPTTSPTLYESYSEETETGTVYREWFTHRKASDIILKTCNAMDDVSPVVDEFKIDTGAGGYVCSTLSRPPGPSYTESYCRAIAFDFNRHRLWVACDDPASASNAYLYEYDVDLHTFTRKVKYVGGGKIRGLWYNAADTTLVVLLHVDIPNGSHNRSVTAYLDKVLDSIADGTIRDVPDDVLQTLTNYCPGTFCYRNGLWVDASEGGSQTSKAVVIGGDRIYRWVGRINKPVNTYVGENLCIPFEQRLLKQSTFKEVPGYAGGSTKADFRANYPNRFIPPWEEEELSALTSHIPYTWALGVNTSDVEAFDGMEEYLAGVRFSLGQAGTTLFWPEDDAGGGSLFYGTFDNTTRQYGFSTCDLDDGAVSVLPSPWTDWPDCIQPVVAISGQTKIWVGFVFWKEDFETSHVGEVSPFMMYEWDGADWTEKISDMADGTGQVILSGIRTGASEMLATVLNRWTGQTCLSTINLSINSLPQNRIMYAGGGLIPFSGKNFLRGFVLADSNLVVGATDRIYFYETGTFLLYSYADGAVRYENKVGETPFPIVDEETFNPSPIAFASEDDGAAWKLYGMTAKQWMDLDGLPYSSAAQHVLWQYSRYFSGFLPLCDFSDMTVHDVRSKIAEMLNAVHYYGPDGTFYFKARPTNALTKDFTFTNVSKMELKSAGYESIINRISGIPYEVNIQQTPSSSPYAMRSSGSTGSLSKAAIASSASIVQEWKVVFVTDSTFNILYRDTGTTLWVAAGSGSIFADYRAVKTLEGDPDYVVIPSSAWGGTTKAGDVYGFWVYPPVKRLVKQEDREAIEYFDATSEDKNGRQEQALDNRFVAKILMLPIITAIVNYWKDPRPVIRGNVPLTPGILPLSVVRFNDERLGYKDGFVNEIVPKQDSPTMDVEALILTDPSSPWGGYSEAN